ncbi:MAG TPA: MFS transporter [Dongiaceae bacterium]|nr:MFS transporter [Dongiaceae bacterium]
MSPATADTVLRPQDPPARTAGSPSDTAEADGLPTPRRYVAMTAVLAAIVLVVLDAAIANLALPTIAQSLGVTSGASVWVVTAYQLAIVMFLLPAGAAGERFGYRGVFMLGVVLFTLASAACAFSTSLPMLVIARFVQGVGSAAVMALAVGLLRFIYPKRLLGAAIGWNAIAVALSGAAGPSIGAAILSVAGWPWLFAVNIPVGIVTLATASALPLVRAQGRRLDIASIALNAGAFGGLFFGIDRAIAEPRLGIGVLAAAAIALILLVRRELPRTSPLIPLDLLRERTFRLSVIASVCCFIGQMAGFVALPFYLQHELGRSAGTAGLVMTAWPLTVAVVAPLSGRLADRFSNDTLCIVGGVSLAAGLALAAFWPLHGSLVPLIPFLMLSGLGFGLFQTPNNRNMLLAAPRERSGAAGGMQGMARLSGQTAGSVVLLLLFGLTSDLHAPHLGLAIGAGFALGAGAISMIRLAAQSRTARA